MRLGDSDLVRENDHADVAEDRPDVDQPPQSARGTREALIRVATLLRKVTNDGSPGAGRDTQSMAFFSTAVIVRLHTTSR
jgi:hypothetical protein